jgi:enoyl-CoA hydratase
LIDQPELFTKDMELGKRLLQSILDCPKPIIAKVNGPAIGLAATIVLFCDIIFAADHARIADSHVKLGLVAGVGGVVICLQLIGLACAKEFLFAGSAITGEEATKIGLINRAVPAADLDHVVDEFAQQLVAGAPKTIQWTKQAVHMELKRVAQSILDTSFAVKDQSNRTRDHQEAVSAFSRKPRRNGDWFCLSTSVQFLHANDPKRSPELHGSLEIGQGDRGF